MNRSKKIDGQLYSEKQVLVMWRFSAFIPRGKILKVNLFTIYLSPLKCPSTYPHSPKQNVFNWCPQQLNLNTFLAFELSWFRDIGGNGENIFLGHFNHESGCLGWQLHWYIFEVQMPSDRDIYVYVSVICGVL